MPFLFDPTSWHDWHAWLSDEQAALAEHVARVAVIVILLVVLEFVFRRVIGRVFVGTLTRAAAARGDDAAALRRRADTLLATMNWAFGIFLLFLGAGLILSELGMNVSALIAGVGVVGIALGLGAQTLVKDVINGMFILIEDQYSVGDLVTVGGATGTVIEINPRRTVLRDAEGNVHTIPNSAITLATNRTPSLNRVRVELRVALRDADAAAAAAEAAASDLAVARRDDVVRAPVIVDRRLAGDGDALLVLSGDARAGARWEVESDLRRRLKRHFEAHHLEVRFEGPAGQGMESAAR